MLAYAKLGGLDPGDQGGARQSSRRRALPKAGIWHLSLAGLLDEQKNSARHR